ncbi:SPARC-like protein 1 isoform X2 [Brienomyrus brachyistius]|uniref:SPARC-like protein 1 isoform X2 n=1 Tax=Brienomyrus brachyistius TaxID=42636 RepID=UPI0020B2E875|nr:SPARC-like protein 1 isoform X2 [Brienomyrus brachyistius]
MHLAVHLILFTMLVLHPVMSEGSRAQRKQRQAEEKLRPYWGRTNPEKLCKLLKCYSPVGSSCQAVEQGGVLIPKCICPQKCPREGVPVCSVLGKTYASECLLHKESCRKKRRTGLAHLGPCLVSKAVCAEMEYGQFPYRLIDWFLMLSRMGQSFSSPPPPQGCLSREERRMLVERRFILLDRNKDGKLSRRDLKKLRYKQMPLEHCAHRFFQSCDSNSDRKVTLKEWIACLVDQSEDWFQDFTSMKMGSRILCATEQNKF